MQRTRKWQHLGSEAHRLAGLGLSPVEIAAQLGVNRSTVHRWMDAGRLEDTRATPSRAPAVADAPLPDAPPTTWADAVRAAAPLDATDLELVNLATFALTVTQSASEAASIRLAAAGRFQSLVKQLAARIRPIDAAPVAPPRADPPATPTRVDPRALLNPTIQ